MNTTCPPLPGDWPYRFPGLESKADDNSQEGDDLPPRHGPGSLLPTLLNMKVRPHSP